MKKVFFFLFIIFVNITFSQSVSKHDNRNQTSDSSVITEKDDFAITYKYNVVIKNLGKNINTEFDEYAPAITGKGKILFFTSTRPNNFSEKSGDEDIWYTIKENEEWGQAQNLGFPINDKGNQGTTAIQPDGQYVYFALPERADGYGNFDLYYSKLEGIHWSTPKDLGPDVNSPYWDHNPTISSDGRTLIFASNRPGGFGKSDLWMTKKDNEGVWSKPVNLGPKINTSAMEMAPFLSMDNKNLFFSSDGKPSVGGFDIFVSQWNNDEWSMKTNIDEPYNSPQDEFFITIPAANDIAYISSNRKGSMENSVDIWSAVPPPTKSMKFQQIVVAVTGIVSEFKSKPLKPVEALITIKDLNSDSTIAQFMSNSVTGQYYVVLPLGRNYGVFASAQGYYPYSTHFNLSKEAKFEEIRNDIPLVDSTFESKREKLKCVEIPETQNNNHETVSDIDDNIYHTVKIGNQIWMVENLKTTKYRNGESITNVTDAKKWNNLTASACCSYHNSNEKTRIYGRLYNWYAVDDSRQIAPIGWHVPSDTEWAILIEYLGGERVAGGKLKEIGFTHWMNPNVGATNENGFSAIPGGCRLNNGTFVGIGQQGYWWSSTESHSSDSWNRYMFYNYSIVTSFNDNKQYGLSVRCIKDPESTKTEVGIQQNKVENRIEVNFKKYKPNW